MKEQFILNDELAEAGTGSVGGFGVMMFGPTLILHGTKEQQDEHLPRILRGEVVWCQGWSEPGAGSDIAALQTRATSDGDAVLRRNSQLRAAFADRFIEAEVAMLFSYRIVTMQAHNLVPGYEASTAKLYLSELNQRIALVALRLYGLAGNVFDRACPEAQHGRIEREYLSSVSSTIAGGTSEIQRNIIATRGLGLPRG